MKQALRPNYFSDFRNISTLKTEKTEDEETDEAEEQNIASLKDHSGWIAVSKYIDRLIEGLDIMVVNLIEQGAEPSLIGEKTIAKEITKEMLKSIQKKVEDARGKE